MLIASSPGSLPHALTVLEGRENKATSITHRWLTGGLCVVLGDNQGSLREPEVVAWAARVRHERSFDSRPGFGQIRRR